jgi:excisionase family DNA binding protein
MTTKEVAARLNLNTDTVLYHIKRGALRATKEGRDWRISEKDVTAFAAQPRRAGRPRKKGNRHKDL